MKQICQNIAKVLKLIFGYGILLCLLAGCLVFFGYIVALIIGGDAAANICHVLYKVIVPYIIKGSTIMVLLGLVAMYMGGEVALTPHKKHK